MSRSEAEDVFYLFCAAFDVIPDLVRIDIPLSQHRAGLPIAPEKDYRAFIEEIFEVDVDESFIEENNLVSIASFIQAHRPRASGK